MPLRPGMTALTLAFTMFACLGAAPAGANPPGSIALLWTGAGDDDMTGIPAGYDVRYSIGVPIDERNFHLCPQVTDIPPPRVGGSLMVALLRDVSPGAVYYFAMKTVDEQGNWSPISNVAMHSGTGTVSASDHPLVLSFAPPAPNPVRGSARCELSLPQAANVRIEAFDLTGRRVRTLVNERRPAGRGDVTWNLRDDRGLPVRAGIYLIRAVLPGKVITHRAVVVR